MVVEPAIAGEAQDLPSPGRAFRPERGWKRPAERPGRPQIGLPDAVQLDHRAGPDPGISGIRNQDCIGGQCPGDFRAQPLDPDRRGVVVTERRHRGAPVGDDARGLLGETGIARRFPDHFVQTGQGCLRVANDTRRVRVAAPNFQGIGIDLHDLCVAGRHRPVQGHLVARIAADEQHEVGAVHDAVRRRRGIAAGDTDGEPVPGRDDATRPEGRRDRRLQCLGEREYLRPRLRGGGPIAGDNRDAASGGEHTGRALDVASVGHRPMCGNAARLGIENRRFGSLAKFDFVALMTREVEMGRPRRVRQRSAPGMAHQSRQFGGQIDGGGKLGHRGEDRRVRNFLVRVAMLKRRRLASGQRNHRGAPQKRVLQPRRQIGRADRLRHTYPRPPDNPGIAVGHIGRRLFRMREDRGHAQILQLQQRAAQHRLDKEDVRRTRLGQRAGQPLGPVHRSVFTQFRFLPVLSSPPRKRRSRG